MRPANLHQFEYRLSNHGSISDIYLARLPHTGDYDHVLKIMKPQYCDNTALRERFYFESHMLASLNHAYIPKLIYKGSVQNRPYLIYRYIEGTTLKNFLHTNREATLETRYALAKQILHLLHYLHTFSEPVVHSDISPQNFIIDDKLNIHLIDFGCAQTISQNLRADTWIGSSDLYQAGLVLYELLTNEKYFKTGNKIELIKLTSNPPSNDLVKVPKHFRSFIKRLINPDLTLRYQSAEEAICAFYRISR